MPTQPASRRGRPPATDPAATRSRIVVTAIELFARQGFHATGVAEIGRLAGVQPGALYYHIGSKDELLWEILSDYIAAVRDNALRVAAAYDDPLARLRALVADHVEMIIAFREQVTIELRDRDALTPPRQHDLQRMRDAVQQVWQGALDDAARAGIIRSADHVLTNAMLTMASMVGRWYRADGPRSPAQIAEIIGDLVLHGIAADGHAAPPPLTGAHRHSRHRHNPDQPDEYQLEPSPKGRHT